MMFAVAAIVMLISGKIASNAAFFMPHTIENHRRVFHFDWLDRIWEVTSESLDFGDFNDKISADKLQIHRCRNCSKIRK